MVQGVHPASPVARLLQILRQMMTVQARALARERRGDDAGWAPRQGQGGAQGQGGGEDLGWGDLGWGGPCRHHVAAVASESLCATLSVDQNLVQQGRSVVCRPGQMQQQSIRVRLARGSMHSLFPRRREQHGDPRLLLQAACRRLFVLFFMFGPPVCSTAAPTSPSRLPPLGSLPASAFSKLLLPLPAAHEHGGTVQAGNSANKAISFPNQ